MFVHQVPGPMPVSPCATKSGPSLRRFQSWRHHLVPSEACRINVRSILVQLMSGLSSLCCAFGAAAGPLCSLYKDELFRLPLDLELFVTQYQSMPTWTSQSCWFVLFSLRVGFVPAYYRPRPFSKSSMFRRRRTVAITPITAQRLPSPIALCFDALWPPLSTRDVPSSRLGSPFFRHHPILTIPYFDVHMFLATRRSTFSHPPNV